MNVKEFQQYRMNKQTQKQQPTIKENKQQNTRSSSGVSDQLTLQDQKKRKFFIKQAIYVIYFVARILLTVFILIVVRENFVQLLTQTSQYDRMQENIGLWKLDVIVNMTVVNSYNCPQGYQTYTAYVWPGTKQGCYCYTSLDQWDYIKILQGACSDLAISAGCRTVPKMKEIPFLFWKKDELICLKRLKNVNFFTDLEYNMISTLTCANNTQHRIDIPIQLNHTLCPITDIENTNTLPHSLHDIGFSFNRQSSYPIISLKMTQYEFCPQFDKENISPFKQRSSNYNLQLITREYCDGIDPRVVVIDQIAEDELFANNPRINDTVKLLPAYPQPMDDYKYKLGFARYPQWKYSCRKSQQFKLTTTQSHLNLYEISDYTDMCIGFCTAFIVVIGAVVTVFFIFRKVSQFYYRYQHKVMYDTLPQLEKKKPNLYEKLHKKFLTQLVIFLLLIITGISVLIILAVLFQQIQTYFLWYKQSKQCTSQVMKQWIDKGYIKYFDMQQKNILLTIILVLCFIIVDTIMFLWRNFKGDLKKQQYEQQTNIFDDDVKQLEHIKTNNNHNLQMENIHKDIDMQNVKYGSIQKNNAVISNQKMNLTQQSFLEIDYLPPSNIVRPKRNKKTKVLDTSVVSQETQQWEI